MTVPGSDRVPEPEPFITRLLQCVIQQVGQSHAGQGHALRGHRSRLGFIGFVQGEWARPHSHRRSIDGGLGRLKAFFDPDRFVAHGR